MRNSAPTAASISGFTLLEVLVASVVLAAAGATAVGIYIHSIEQATSARDLTYAASAARNALEEGIAGVAAKKASGQIPERPSLVIVFDDQPAGEDLLTDTLKATVTDNSDPAAPAVLEFTTKTALYVEPAEGELQGDRQ